MRERGGGISGGRERGGVEVIMDGDTLNSLHRGVRGRTQPPPPRLVNILLWEWYDGGPYSRTGMIDPGLMGCMGIGSMISCKDPRYITTLRILDVFAKRRIARLSI